MYHSISNKPANLGHRYFETNTRPEAFRLQMEYLKERQYSVVLLEDLISLGNATQSGGKRVVITFDDGYEDFHRNAFPILQEFGFTATVFLPTGFIGDRPMELNGRACMTWGQVIEAMRGGVRFGSHTVTHPKLKTLPPARMDAELRESKSELEDRLGAGIDAFSFPFAFPEDDRQFVSRYHECLERHGYRIAVNTRIGRAGRESNRFSMPRLPVNDHDDIPFLGAKLEGGYDWLGYLQHGKKIAAKWLGVRGG